MSLATRCPDCKTLFKVTASQLQQHGGKVKCGFCGSVFSGVQELTPADADAWLRSQEPRSRFSDEEPDSGPSADAEAALLRLNKVNRGEITADDHVSKLPGVHRREMWPLRAQLRLAGLLLLLLWQMVWWQRNAVSAAFPLLDSPLSSLAELVGTQVTAPASKNIVIVGSAINNNGGTGMRADIRIAHRGKQASQWPVIRLEILDSQQARLDTVTLSPTDYAVKPDLYKIGSSRILPGQEFDLVAYFDTKKLSEQFPESPPTGFRLTVFDQNP